MTGADLTDAIVSGANFSNATTLGFTKEQLYSTASYKTKDLTGTLLRNNNLTGWSFAGQNLVGADFYSATLTDADLSGADLSFADLRGASFDPWQGPWSYTPDLAAATTSSTIMPDGSIGGLELGSDERLVVRNHELSLTIEESMTLAESATLELVFAEAAWGSTISFEPGIGVSLDGALELSFDWDAQPLELANTTFDLFNWEGANVTGAFAEAKTTPGAAWDTDDLYTTGEVTFLFQAAAGDVNLDREINNADLQQILGANSFNNGTGFDWTQGDFDGDTDVDNDDLQLILATGLFGTGPYAAIAPGTREAGLVVVPEPSTVAMLTMGVLGLAALAWRRKRLPLPVIALQSAQGGFLLEYAVRSGVSEALLGSGAAAAATRRGSGSEWNLSRSSERR